jgi:D-alanyl-D-alanine carboxypeptidase/D-alanyl-D-alanine-endopeptidase (penicillin-binding protein 4)
VIPTRLSRASLLLAASVLAALPACAARSRPPAPPAAAAPAREAESPTGTPVERLAAELDAIFGAAALAHASWGVAVQSLENGETLYRLNPARLLMPASNMKIVTVAAAAERLGWDHRFETRLVTSAPIENGVLGGDLIVVGGGDPTINARGGLPTRVFESWAAELRALGIHAIDGRIVGDDNAFDDEGLAAGWSWDYLAYGYAAPSGALEYNESTVTIAIRPGAAPGDPAVVAIDPAGSIPVVNRLVTSNGAGTLQVDQHWRPGTAGLQLSGTVPAGTEPFTRKAAVTNPTDFFARALRETLIAQGIAVHGAAVDIDELEDAHAEGTNGGGTPRVLVTHRSPPLSEIAVLLMKVSHNLYADTLLKALGAGRGAGSIATGREVVGELLEAWGIPGTAYVMYDGSGLSRYNYLSADLLVRILRRMHLDPAHRQPFRDAMPIAGQDGTLSQRLKGTRAAGNVRAKTGSIANVRSLSGYLTTADGEPLAFSMLANNFTVPRATIDAAVDLAVERLAAFSRKD